MKPNAEQIKKAFEYCKNNNGECPKECPLFADTECTQTLGFYGLSLINSYERKNKILTKKAENWIAIAKDLQKEIDELIEDNQAKDETITNLIATIKDIQADTVRKMQEMLCEGRVSNDPVVIATNVAAKEMLEGKEET